MEPFYAFLYSSPLSHGCFPTNSLKHHSSTSSHRSISFKSRSIYCQSLPNNLQTIVTQFKSVPDPKLRYQQLLFLAKELPPMPNSLKIESNKVPGCLSTVYVDVTLEGDSQSVYISGDSDAQLTKGLIALLIRGLNGSQVDEILKVDASFIVDSGLSVSLTPGRNNGFLNMLETIKEKVRKSVSAQSTDSTDKEVGSSGLNGPVYESIWNKLQMLKPDSLKVIDNSAQHAGHAGAQGLNGESHFEVFIVSSAFDGLKSVKRHQLIYTLLSQELQNGVHALQIHAKTPQEINSQQ